MVATGITLLCAFTAPIPGPQTTVGGGRGGEPPVETSRPRFDPIPNAPPLPPRPVLPSGPVDLVPPSDPLPAIPLDPSGSPPLPGRPPTVLTRSLDPPDDGPDEDGPADGGDPSPSASPGDGVGASRPPPTPSPSSPTGSTAPHTASAGPAVSPPSEQASPGVRYGYAPPAAGPGGRLLGTAAAWALVLAALTLALRLTVGWPRFPPRYRGRRRTNSRPSWR
ncbi:hypothetical protein GCM10022205_13220 [Spinactinospora alkalitolerans]